MATKKKKTDGGGIEIFDPKVGQLEKDIVMAKANEALEEAKEAMEELARRMEIFFKKARDVASKYNINISRDFVHYDESTPSVEVGFKMVVPIGTIYNKVRSAAIKEHMKKVEGMKVTRSDK
jgi:hypothetical protein